eukprot:900128-Amphidinium_carterae.2
MGFDISILTLATSLKLDFAQLSTAYIPRSLRSKFEHKSQPLYGKYRYATLGEQGALFGA